MNEYYNYSDIYLKPRYSELSSRAQADISVDFLGRKFKAPWLPSNMSSVINEDIAKWCSENDYFYIMHRFGNNKALLVKANIERWKYVSISLGVNAADREFIEWWSHNTSLFIDCICIDVAHGHHLLVKQMIEHIKLHFDGERRSPKIIAGNVCTPEAVKDLAEWGADCVKVGIAGGGACSTKNMTGFHVPMFSCVNDCAVGEMQRVADVNYKNLLRNEYFCRIKEIPIIADGGIRENGDIPKALVAGAKMVMAGSIFAACIDAPGENVYSYKYKYENLPYIKQVQNKIIAKRYFGSASARQKGEKKHIEGFEVELPCNGLTYAEKYNELTESMQSAVSYGGGKDLSCFKDVEWIVKK